MTTELMSTYRLASPHHFRPEAAPRPVAADLADGEVLVRVLAAGICGSDLPGFAGWLPPPSPLAAGLGGPFTPRPGWPLHEVVGDVVATRDDALPVGSRVVGWATGADALSEYVVSAGEGLIDVDPAMPLEHAITLQPLACVLYALEQLDDVAGLRAAVLGLGPIGMLFCHVLRSWGVSRLTGVDPVDRSDMAEAYGIDDLVTASSRAWAAATEVEAMRPEVIIEAVGHQVSTLTDAIAAAAPHAQIYYFGIPDDTVYPLPMLAFLRKNLVLRSGATLEKRASLVKARAYAEAHPDLASYVTHSLPIAQIDDAFHLASRAAPGQLKVVVRRDPGAP